MKQEEKTTNLSNNRNDYIAMALKSGLGAIPVAGSFLSEIINNSIPNQRIDRIVKFAEILELRLSQIENSLLEIKLSNENFLDLVEEGLHQAVKTADQDRRCHIASIIANSILSDDIAEIESKHLLRILKELNKIEVIWLRSFLHNSLKGDEDFREKYKHILKPVSASLESSQTELDKSTLQISYKEHLSSLGLLEKISELEALNGNSKLKTKNYEITSLGRLLLREINTK